jgi:uncharacterized protein YdaT
MSFDVNKYPYVQSLPESVQLKIKRRVDKLVEEGYDEEDALAIAVSGAQEDIKEQQIREDMMFYHREKENGEDEEMDEEIVENSDTDFDEEMDERYAYDKGDEDIDDSFEDDGEGSHRKPGNSTEAAEFAPLYLILSANGEWQVRLGKDGMTLFESDKRDIALSEARKIAKTRSTDLVILSEKGIVQGHESFMF